MAAEDAGRKASEHGMKTLEVETLTEAKEEVRALAAAEEAQVEDEKKAAEEAK